MNICAVTVTFNRLDKLKKTLEAFSAGAEQPNTLVVVNNASTDKTEEYLAKWVEEKCSYQRIVINLKENTGGSGGFNAGIKKALELDSDWIYIGDDDAYINEDTIRLFKERSETKDPSIGAIACEVDSPDGIMLGHRRVLKKNSITLREMDSKEDDYKKDSFTINLFSFVGVFLNANYARKIDLPRKDYFIWYDDTEYSSRLSRISKVICVPSMKVYHDCKFEEIKFCWKSYYGYRNKLDTLKTVHGKRYYLTFLIALKLSTFLDIVMGKKLKAQTKNVAISDFIDNRMGKNENYLPGIFKL